MVIVSVRIRTILPCSQECAPPLGTLIIRHGRNMGRIPIHPHAHDSKAKSFLLEPENCNLGLLYE